MRWYAVQLSRAAAAEAGIGTLGVVHGILEVRRLRLGVENAPHEVRRGKLEAGNPPLDPVPQRLEAERPKPEAGNPPPGVENPALGVENGKLEVEHEPLEPEHQRLEVERKALEHEDGARLGRNTGPDRADRRQAGGPLLFDNRYWTAAAEPKAAAVSSFFVFTEAGAHDNLGMCPAAGFSQL